MMAIPETIKLPFKLWSIIQQTWLKENKTKLDSNFTHHDTQH